MNKIIIPIGAPRSGKSTYFDENFANSNIVQISRDLIRENLFGTRDNFTNEEIVSKVFDNMLNNAFEAKKDVYIDNTNLKLKYRKKFYELARKNGYKIHVIVFYTELSILMDRAEKTNFPKDVILKMIQGMDIFQMEENETVHNTKYVFTSDKGIVEAINELINYDQKSEFHSLTLGEHLRKAGKYIAENKKDKTLTIPAICHDIAKPFVATKKESGYNSYPSHAKLSAYQYISLSGRVKYITLRNAFLISRHMDRFNDYGNKYITKTTQNLKRLGSSWNDLESIWEADNYAH